MNQQGRSQSRKDENQTELIKYVGGVQNKADETERKVNAATAAISSLEKTNGNVVETNLQVVVAVKDLKAVTTQGSDELRRELKASAANIERIADHYTQTTQDLTEGFNATGKEILGRLDNVHADVNKIPQAVLDGINWDDLIARTKLAIGDIVAIALADCLKSNGEMAKELDIATAAVDHQPEPEPPTPPTPDPGARQPIPVDFEPAALLPKTGTD